MRSPLDKPVAFGSSHHGVLRTNRVAGAWEPLTIQVDGLTIPYVGPLSPDDYFPYSLSWIGCCYALNNTRRPKGAVPQDSDPTHTYLTHARFHSEDKIYASGVVGKNNWVMIDTSGQPWVVEIVMSGGDLVATAVGMFGHFRIDGQAYPTTHREIGRIAVAEEPQVEAYHKGTGWYPSGEQIDTGPVTAAEMLFSNRRIFPSEDGTRVLVNLWYNMPLIDDRGPAFHSVRKYGTDLVAVYLGTLSGTGSTDPASLGEGLTLTWSKHKGVSDLYKPREAESSITVGTPVYTETAADGGTWWDDEGHLMHRWTYTTTATLSEPQTYSYVPDGGIDSVSCVFFRHNAVAEALLHTSLQQSPRDVCTASGSCSKTVSADDGVGNHGYGFCHVYESRSGLCTEENWSGGASTLTASWTVAGTEILAANGMDAQLHHNARTRQYWEGCAYMEATEYHTTIDEWVVGSYYTEDGQPSGSMVGKEYGRVLVQHNNAVLAELGNARGATTTGIRLAPWQIPYTAVDPVDGTLVSATGQWPVCLV